MLGGWAALLEAGTNAWAQESVCAGLLAQVSKYFLTPWIRWGFFLASTGLWVCNCCHWLQNEKSCFQLVFYLLRLVALHSRYCSLKRCLLLSVCVLTKYL